VADGAACPGTGIYRPRRPERTVLHQTVREHLETWLAHHASAEFEGFGVPARIEAEFRRYLECGILAHGFSRARCGTCGQDFLIAFSCKGRGLCPSCATRRMVETAAHLVDHVFPRVPVRQRRLSRAGGFRVAKEARLACRPRVGAVVAEAVTAVSALRPDPGRRGAADLPG
jgi:hypothetical protein